MGEYPVIDWDDFVIVIGDRGFVKVIGGRGNRDIWTFRGKELDAFDGVISISGDP